MVLEQIEDVSRISNCKAGRVERRLACCQTGTPRVVVAFRERQGSTPPFVTLAESEGVALAMKNVDKLAFMSADEAAPWDDLRARWPMHRVNHSEVYSDHGKNTNQMAS